MATPTYQVNVRITADLHERLHMTQRNTGKSQAEIIRLLLDKHLDVKAQRPSTQGVGKA